MDDRAVPDDRAGLRSGFLRRTRASQPPHRERVAALARLLWHDLRIGLLIGLGMIVVYLPRADAASSGMTLPVFMQMLVNIYSGWSAAGFLIVLLNRVASQVWAALWARMAFVLTISVLLRLAVPMPVQQVGFNSNLLALGASSTAFLLEVTWTTVLCAAITTAWLDRAARRRSAAQRLADLHRQQQRARRELVEARLRVLQARVDPQLFFDMLGAVRDHYASDPLAAEALLERLTVFLRAALPRLRTAMSTVRQEVDLVAAYADMRQAAGFSSTLLSAVVEPAAAEGAFPAGVLLPLIEALLHGLAGAPGRIELEATRAPRALRLRLQGAIGTPVPEIERVRGTLAAVYADQAVLSVRLGLAGTWVIEVEVRDA